MCTYVGPATTALIGPATQFNYGRATTGKIMKAFVRDIQEGVFEAL